MIKVGDTLNGFTVTAVAGWRVTRTAVEYVAVLAQREGVRGDVTEVEYVTATMIPADDHRWSAGHYYGPSSTAAGSSRDLARARADFASRAGWGLPDDTDGQAVKVYLHGAI